MKPTPTLHLIIFTLIFFTGLLTLEPVAKHSGSYSTYGLSYHTFPEKNYSLPIAGSNTTATAKKITSPASTHESKKEMETSATSLAFTYSLGDAMLIGEEGSMAREARLTIGGLFREELPALNAGMVNVTGEYGAYRMLPHGMVFEKDIDIILPYDTALLPMGFTPYDIMTYYYDEQYGRWIAIYRDSVDVAGHRIYSKVNHFTDFINAVIRTPEMPETQGYVPTQMSDIKVADPATGISRMQMATTNHKGDANLNIPVEIPPGRQGMQPHLNITYNSSGGKGWLGVGWDVAIPSITVETRWGVPHYDNAKESEVYLLNGEQLATKDHTQRYEPLAHREKWTDRRPGPVQFYPRTEGGFQKIIRHGNSPQDYWWEVRDKSGMIYYYGKKSGSDEVDPSSVLCTDDAGNIARWGLTEIRDLHGNFVLYSYELVRRIHNGKALYIKDITYTGYDAEPGRYKVEFERTTRSALGFKDVTLHCRTGVAEVNDDLLALLKVSYDGEILNMYCFQYKENQNSKSTVLYRVHFLPSHYFDVPYRRILSALQNLPDPDKLPHPVHSFRYHDSDITYSDPVEVTTGNDSEANGYLAPFVNIPATSLGGTTSKNWNVGGGLTVGIGYNASVKTVTLGGNYAYSGSSSEGLLTLIDIDGDGLPDKVFRDRRNDRLYYRKQSLDEVGRSRFSSQVTPIVIEGEYASPSFMSSENESHDLGIEGHLSFFGAGATAAGNWNWSTSSTNTYFSDVDGDGLPDIVREGLVYFNRPQNGVAKFILNKAEKLMMPVGTYCDSSFIYQDVPVNEGLFMPGDTFVRKHCRTVTLGENLIVNGNFEAGFAGFDTDYQLFSSGMQQLPGQCYVARDGSEYNRNLPVLYDHTHGNGDGRYLIYSLYRNRFPNVLWQQDVPVEANTCYNFSFWYANYLPDHSGQSTDLLTVYVNGEEQGVIRYPEDFTPNRWRQKKFTVSSGNHTTAEVKIVQKEATGIIKEVFLDDLSFTPCRKDTVICRYDTTIIPGKESIYPDHDAVRLWVAPYSGMIRLTGDACLTADLMEARQLTPAMDGVKLSIQINESEVDFAWLYPGDSAGYGPQSCYSPSRTFRVEHGDRFYFRLRSRESRLYDKVHWVPRIEYTSLAPVYNDPIADPHARDGDGKYIYIFDAAEDFLINADRKCYYPLSGMGFIKYESIFSINRPLSSDIRVRVDCGACSYPLYERYFPRGSTIRELNIEGVSAALEGDSLWFTVESSSNVDWQAIDWQISYHYLSSDLNIPMTDNSDPANPRPTVKVDNIVPHLSTFPRPLAPTRWHTLANSFRLSQLKVSILGARLNSRITLVVRSAGGEVARSAGVISNVSQVIFPFSGEVLASGTPYAFDLYLDDKADYILPPSVDISGRSYPVGLHTRQPDKMGIYGEMYNNWGQFTYRADPSDGDVIKEWRLHLPLARMTDDAPQEMDGLDTSNILGLRSQMKAQHYYDPLDDHFLMMEPDYKNKRWYGYSNITYVTADTVSNTFYFENGVNHFTYPFFRNSLRIPTVAVARQDRTESEAGTFGFTLPDIPVGELSLSLVGSISSGESRALSQYMDLNGDRYPDVLSETAVQYSKPQGGLSTLSLGHPGLEESTFDGQGETYGASFVFGKKVQNTGKRVIESSGNAGANVNTGENRDYTRATWMDVNGDGLPDRIRDDGKVDLNLGYSYLYGLEFEGMAGIGDGESRSTAGSLGGGYGSQSSSDVNVFQGSIAGGLGFGRTRNSTNLLFIDMNNDGLPDILFREAALMKVCYNLGTTFSGPQELNLHSFHPLFSETVNGNIYAAFGVGFTVGSFPVKFVVNPRGGGNWAVNQVKQQMIDLNGDGYPDYVSSTDVGTLYVQYAQPGPRDLIMRADFQQEVLLMVHEIAFEQTRPTVNQPAPKWVVKDIWAEEGAGNISFATNEWHAFQYADPFHDRYEREDYGFGRVITTIWTSPSRDPGTGELVDPYKRTIVEEYHNTDYMRKGLKYYESVSDDQDRMVMEKQYIYALKHIETGEVIRTYGAYCYGEGYPALNEEYTHYHAPRDFSANIETRKRYEHGSYGNIIRHHDDGEFAYGGGELTTEIEYFRDVNGLYLTGIPSGVTVRDSEGNTLRKRSSQICPNTGKPLSVTVDNTHFRSVYDFSYDRYGNRILCRQPENMYGQRMFYEYEYDQVVHTYPVHTINALDHHSYAEYDYRWGRPVLTTDINGNEIEYEYDLRGRLKKVRGPHDPEYTLRFYYSFDDPDWTFPACNEVFVAQTEHYNVQHPDYPIVTISFSNNGIFSVIKKEVEIGDDMMLAVSGYRLYRGFDKVWKEADVVLEPLAMYYHLDEPWQVMEREPYTEYTYDALSRPLTVTTPDGETTTSSYDFQRDGLGALRFSQTVTDPEGNSVITYTDTRGLITTTENRDIITSFLYTSLGELEISYDPEGLKTGYEYDMQGNCIYRNHPDAGIEHYIYDPAGNMTERTSEGGVDRVNYEFNYNQLSAIYYQKYPENNVFYEYGSYDDYMDRYHYNRVGRLKYQRDLSGVQEFRYGKLGEVIENRRTFVTPVMDGSFTFITRYEYDSWNRIQKIEYPDGEKVRYYYGLGGNLKRVQGDMTYIDDIQYNRYGRRTSLLLGNNTKTSYDYDEMQRLSRLQTVIAGGVDMQAISYTYDRVGNILEQSTHSIGGAGGNNQKFYHYDPYYRLTEAEFYFENSQGNMSISYTPNGKIEWKDMNFEHIEDGYRERRGYHHDYNYDRTFGNRLDYINGGTQEFSWDGKGNLLTHEHHLEGRYRRLCWDDENRLSGVTDEGANSTRYFYDAGGERFFKLNGHYQSLNINGRWHTRLLFDNPTLYVSANLVVTPQGYTKHYYAGTERIASRIGEGSFEDHDQAPEDMLPYHENQYRKIQRDAEMLSEETGEVIKGQFDFLRGYAYPEFPFHGLSCFWYHPDHLGSSSWITNECGHAMQYLDYLPFGELWISQRNTYWNARYTFSGKERDGETGYSYFGARYYDADLSIWLSVDPLAHKYPGWSPYNYCLNNPVKLVDPNGETPRPYGLLAHYGLALGGNSRLGEAQTVGAYNVVPFYDNNNNLLGYNAGRWVASGREQVYRTEYQMAPGDLAGFKANAGLYEACANMIYAAGEPNWNTVAFGDMMSSGNFSGAIGALGSVWADALQSPDFWVAAAFSLGVGTLNLKTVNGINLNKSQLKSIASLEQQIILHTEKLKAYKASPWKFDNMGYLKNAPNEGVRQRIIQSRVNHLEKEIKTFQNNIQKILNE